MLNSCHPAFYKHPPYVFMCTCVNVYVQKLSSGFLQHLPYVCVYRYAHTHACVLGHTPV